MLPERLTVERPERLYAPDRPSGFRISRTLPIAKKKNTQGHVIFAAKAQVLHKGMQDAQT